MHDYRLLIELLSAAITGLAAAWGFYHQYGIITKQRNEIEEQKKEIEARKKEIEEQRSEAQTRRNEINQLRQDKAQYQKEVDDLGDIKNIKSLKLVESKLEELDPPLCIVCKSLLYLRICTSLSGAIKQFTNLGKVAELNPKPKIDRRVLNVLEKAITHSLWQTPLEPDRPETEFVTQTIQAYTSLTSNIQTDELPGVIRFCVACCDERPILRKEAVRNLLPSLFLTSRGDNELVQVYRKLLEGFSETPSKEQRHLLVSIFSGLMQTALVDSGNMTEIWELTFKVATADVAWAWGEKDGPNIGGPWCDAIETRLPLADKNEKEALRKLTSDYLITERAPLHSLSYNALSRVLGGGIRPAIQSEANGYRKVDRAVVPKWTEIPIEISVAGNPMTIMGRVINFSLELSLDKTVGRGVWATADFNQAPTEIKNWRSATVAMLYPKGERIVFNTASVYGPLYEIVNSNPYWGFRIKLGPSSPDDGIAPLKDPWKNWTKR